MSETLDYEVEVSYTVSDDKQTSEFLFSLPQASFRVLLENSAAGSEQAAALLEHAESLFLKTMEELNKED